VKFNVSIQKALFQTTYIAVHFSYAEFSFDYSQLTNKLLPRRVGL
jgi:hypothetical protein